MFDLSDLVVCAGDLADLVKHAHQPLRKTTKINHITTGQLKNRSDKHIHIQVRQQTLFAGDHLS